MSNSEKVFHEYLKIIGSKDGRFRQLLVYADRLLRRKNISGRAITAEDVISEIITKIAYGERTWDTEAEPDLYLFLFMIIKSHIYNLRSFENKYLKPQKAYKQGIEELSFQNFVEQNHLLEPMPVERMVDTRDIACDFLEYFKDDIVASLVIIDLCKGLERKAIAQDLSVNLIVIDTAIKRIRRRLRKN